MKLRKLERKDAPLMMEWMHDASVVEFMQANFKEKTLEDCERFIAQSLEDFENLHLAIANDEDEYMGTVSLKSISTDKGEAEFAIAIRREAMGQGYAWFGMEHILQIGFEEYCLRSIYWCVSAHNIRACRFYNKHGFVEREVIPAEILADYGADNDLKWYAASRQ